MPANDEIAFYLESAEDGVWLHWAREGYPVRHSLNLGPREAVLQALDDFVDAKMWR